MYPPELVAPMRAELVDAGIRDLTTAAEVDEVLAQPGTTLVVVNSVCGCAAGAARPGVIAALQKGPKPDRMVTVFAGVAHEATKRARQYMLPYPPSSPSIALFKDGELVHMIERHHIEGRPAVLIAANLAAAFEEHCQQHA
ncbi:MAG: BrxA/BrxB family bacilliredoxin [Bacteroidetes bacterium]|nr:MAG: BrxA/BrxB family bacilliredoxin [Bacteroidota bacterium]